MDSSWARGAVLLASIVMVAIRAPYGQRSRAVPIASRHTGGREFALLTIAWVAFALPIVWALTGWPSSAAYRLRPVLYAAGVAALAAGLWLFYRTHADLGRHWSMTLEVREGHRLVQEGLYRRIRHPMYLALLVYSAGLALAIPNYVAGLSNLIAMALLVAFRIGPEERMMLATFGPEYEAYRGRSWRLVPGVW